MFNLLRDAWIPVVTRSSARETISFSQISSGDYVDIAWNRADFRVATYELLIGLLAVTAAPQDEDRWHDLFEEAPTAGDLAQWSDPLRDCFNLDGDGPRFMQALEPLEGDAVSPSGLLIDAPGANTLRKNADFFIRHQANEAYSRAGAMIALFALQAFAPSGGAGHRTSMRGGGPMTTLIDPRPAGGTASLWQRLWAHVPILTGAKTFPKDRNDWSVVLPWLAPTETSEKGLTVEEDQVHSLQAYFGMPRRIRLDFRPNTEGQACPLTGEVDETVVTGFVTRPWGSNYGVWKHPLTPYYKPKTGPMLPAHPRGGTICYRDWIGVSFSSPERGREIAKAVSDFQEQEPAGLKGTDLIVAGYAMNNASVKEFIEARVPLFQFTDKAVARKLAYFAEQMVEAAETVEFRLRSELAKARMAESSESVVAAFTDAFWQQTEQPFRDMVSEAAQRLASAGDDPSQAGDPLRDLRTTWRGCLIDWALRLFDRAMPPEDLLEMKDEDAKIYTKARLRLVWLGIDRKFHEKLDLPLPEKRKQAAEGDNL